MNIYPVPYFRAIYSIRTFFRFIIICSHVRISPCACARVYVYISLTNVGVFNAFDLEVSLFNLMHINNKASV